MPKGGARAVSGPAPDPNALRRERDSDQWTTLPAEGRQGPPPKWPLTKQTSREKTLWAREWTRPQAIMWERNRQELEVALYIRSLVTAERPEASVNSRTLVRQQQEALGLSLPGLARNRWRIEGVQSPPVPKAPAKRSASRSRARLKGLNGGRG